MHKGVLMVALGAGGLFGGAAGAQTGPGSPSATAVVARVCEPDRARFCSELTRGSPVAAACLEQRHVSLALPCRQALAHLHAAAETP